MLAWFRVVSRGGDQVVPRSQEPVELFLGVGLDLGQAGGQVGVHEDQLLAQVEALLQLGREVDRLGSQAGRLDDGLVGHGPHKHLGLLAHLVHLEVPVVDDAGGDDGDVVAVAVVAVVLLRVAAQLGWPENCS